MKKIFTSILAAVMAAMTFSASADWYVVGQMQGNWDPANPIPMTQTGDTWTYDLGAITGKYYFCVCTGGNSDWDVFNSELRYAPQQGDLDVDIDTSYPLVKIEGTIVINGDGSDYEVVIDASNNLKILKGETPPFQFPPFVKYQNDCEYFCYFVNDQAWNPVYIYTWNGYDNGTWPGTANATLAGLDDDNVEVYLWKMPVGTDMPGMIIFNNNQGAQTADLEFVKGGYYNSRGLLAIVSITTGISDVNAEQVKDVKYVNLAGMASSEPFDGVNIVVKTMTDGTQQVTKIVK
ncbi:MAG: starch-binding protein [Muribaculaceae bacterium]|nr:starch-binding protein [Muribaculaceae bacterium]